MLSPINQLLCALRFYATGCTQVSSGDYGGFSQPTANRIIHRVTSAITGLRPMYIKFPDNNAAIKEAQLEFYSIARFPKAMGAMDCTLVKILSLGGPEAELCSRRAHFENGRYEDAILLVDGGYACKPYLMPPLEAPASHAEHLYNESQIRSPNPIERMFGIWKRRFPCLALGLKCNVHKAMAKIVACAILHNVARQRGDVDPIDDPALQLPVSWSQLLNNGKIQRLAANIENRPHIRRMLIDSYFSSLD